MSGRARIIVVGPGAAVAVWAMVLVVLNVTGSALVAAAAWGALAIVAWNAGRRWLVGVSALAGLGMLILVPGLGIADGSLRVALPHGMSSVPQGSAAWLTFLGSALRVPAQILAGVLLLLVPAPLLLHAASRVSPRTALLAALTARMQPLLSRDIRTARDELASRGYAVDRRGPQLARFRAAIELWNLLVSGVMDRALATAAALHVRGFDGRTPPFQPMRHPALASPLRVDRRVDRVAISLSVGAIAAALGLRSSGRLAAPALHPLAEHAAVHPVADVVLACLVAGAVLVPMLRAASTDRSDTEHSVAPRVNAAPRDEARAVDASLALRHVTMSYPTSTNETPALTDVSLDVRPGELVVVVGASGSGKSTLLDVISGVAPATTGGIRRGLVAVGQRSIAHTQTGLAAVFQVPETQVLVGVVADEIAVGPRQQGLPPTAVEQRVLRVLDELGIRHLARRDCATLSGGELQRVLLAAALALDPDVLVLDEPTSQIDVASERRFWDAVELARAHRRLSVVVAEHRIPHVRALADRVIVLDAGLVVGEVSVGDPSLMALAASAYDGLVPNPPAHDQSPVLDVHLPRVAVPDGAGATRTLLRGLSMTLAPRSIVTLEGPNGTGKSTLLRAIRGLHDAPGVVRVSGHRVTNVAGSAAYFGMVLQTTSAMCAGASVHASAHDVVRRLGGDRAFVDHLIDEAGLAHRRWHHPSQLSVGERQRLAFIAATAHRPPVWLLDEPTRGLDAAARRWLAQRVLQHAASGGVVLIATHDAELAAAVATHRLRLDARTGPTLVHVERDAVGRVVEHTAALPIRSAPNQRQPQ